MPGPGGLDQ